MEMEISSPLDLRQGSWNSAVSRQSNCSEEAPTGFKVGEKLGRIVHGRPETTNIAFGGDDWKTLYFTNWYYLGAVKVKIPGISVPTPKKS